MIPELTAPKQPIALRTELIVDRNTSFRVQQHGKGMSGGKFTIFKQHEQGHLSEKGASAEKREPETIIEVDGSYLAKDEKRLFRDGSGLPLFNVYHRALGVTWFVELPGGSGDPIARVMPRFSTLKDNLDVQVKNAAANGEEIMLHVKGQDIWKLRTNVYLGDKIIMTAKRTDKLSVYLPGRKIEWAVDVAAGMDIALASLIVVIMGANMYDSSMQASSSS